LLISVQLLPLRVGGMEDSPQLWGLEFIQYPVLCAIEQGGKLCNEVVTCVLCSNFMSNFLLDLTGRSPPRDGVTRTKACF
jgi:hypothetical protein